MFLCPACLKSAITAQTINKLLPTGQAIYRVRYCKRCNIRIITKEETVETTYYMKRTRNAQKEDKD